MKANVINVMQVRNTIYRK